ncbi:hypothetical protein [Aliivibrio fischeri]|uniref:hypothetical protein n=1 Tax=Aliivibrio fischeri TaxID=668 RepID=UPI0012D8F143|nr:hypothetical protein [Aliivibrio fischeri]MUK28471.1 hypothetical protein [Aliivibrio fischeri]MUK35950.1 hypothetical protein [Aliivibrio fischeri]
MNKVILGIVSLLISITYLLGFLFDSAFLEKFGFVYYEMVGDSLEYLTIGGMYLFGNFAAGLFWFILVSAIIGCGFVPFKRWLQESGKNLNKFVDLESVPYILIALIPVLFIVIVPVVNDAQSLAKEYKEATKPRAKVCIKDKNVCYKGIVVKYRSGKLVFLSKEEDNLNRIIVVPEKNILLVEQIS